MARFPFRPPAAAVLPLVLLAACADRADFPSLAPRAVERAEVAPAPAPTAPAADPALDARAVALAEQAAKGDADFARTADAGCPTMVRGIAAAEGSEPWLAAQQQLSALDAARAPVAAAAAALDRLAIDTAQGDRVVNAGALLAAAGQVAAVEAAEEARLARIRSGSCER